MHNEIPVLDLNSETTSRALLSSTEIVEFSPCLQESSPVYKKTLDLFLFNEVRGIS